MSSTSVQDSRSRKLSIAGSTILVFVGLGPPIGSIVLGGLMGYFPWMFDSGRLDAGDSSQSDVGAVLLLLGLAGIPASYWWGGLQAFLTGLVVAAYGMVWARPPIWVAGVAALLAFGLAVALGIRFNTHPALGMILVYLIAALVCWAVVQLSWLRVAQ